MSNLIKNTKNILLSNFSHIPFDLIKNEDFVEAINEYILLAESNIESIVKDEENSFTSTIEALEFSTRKIDQAYNLLNNKNRCYTDDETQKIFKDSTEKINILRNNLWMNKALFNKIQGVYSNRNKFILTPEQNTLLERKYFFMQRNGVTLDDDYIKRLKEINIEISNLVMSFEEKLLSEKKNIFLHITDVKDLEGLTDDYLDIAKKESLKRNLEGWVFTLDIPSYQPFMTYVKKRELREKMYIMYSTRCNNNDSNDTKEVVTKITKLRHEKANLLGFKTHADFVLSDRMADTPETVFKFIEDIRGKAIVKAEKELIEIKKFVKDLEGENFIINKWDFAFYTEKMRKNIYDYDDMVIKQYFMLENCVDGMFQLANKLYGIKFIQTNDIPKYNKEVQTYEVYDESNELIGYFFCDFFPREDKQNGGWVYNFSPQFNSNFTKQNNKPYVGIFCNFPRPNEFKPSLLSFSHVNTLFHEFGHALHSMFSEVSYPSLSNINVLWDFVELPSQIMQNFIYETDVINMFARHYDSNEKIPPEYVEKIKNSKNFLIGFSSLRQTNFSYLDMRWHYNDFPKNENDSLDLFKKMKDFENECMVELIPDIDNCLNIASFLHLFNSTYDYSAGYYSYHWAEVLDSDAYLYFKENGILSRKIGEEFRNKILKKGGTEHPMKLYQDFRGKEPTLDAFFIKKNLI